jgi:transcription antitermination factor NusG
MKRSEEAMKGTLSEFVWRMFEPGTSIVVGEGPLQGLRGTVLGIDESHRLVVAVALLRGLIPVALDPTGVYVDDRVTEAQLLKH